MDEQRLDTIKRLADKCAGLRNAQYTLIKGAGDTYGIEFEGYQTLKLEVKPIFDMDDEELDALLNLLAMGIPSMADIIEEIGNLNSEIRALVGAIATVAFTISRHSNRQIEYYKEAEDNNSELTIGEK